MYVVVELYICRHVISPQLGSMQLLCHKVKTHFSMERGRAWLFQRGAPSSSLAPQSIVYLLRGPGTVLPWDEGRR